MTHEDLNKWLRRYGAAWERRDGDLAASLFSEDGIYCWGPYNPPLKGREAIRDRRRLATDTQRDVSFRHEILDTDGTRAFVRWWSRFTESATGSRVELDGVFVLDFPDGRSLYPPAGVVAQPRGVMSATFSRDIAHSRSPR